MSFFKRSNKYEIPPVEGPPLGSRPTYHSNARTYVPSRDGDPYNVPSSQSASYTSPEAPRDKYSRSNGVGDVYSRGGAEVDKDRNELFSGYNPQKSGSSRFFDGPQLGREPAPGEENEEDVEGIKQQTRFVKQESVNSTRNALRMAREAEETARNTLTRLGDQSGMSNNYPSVHPTANFFETEKLANTERHLDVSKGHSGRADDKTDELKQLNRSIFRPVITFNKDSKRAAQEAKVQARYDEEREEREKAMLDIRNTQNRLGQAQTYGREDEDQEVIGGGNIGRGRFKTADQLATRKEQRRRFQFEGNASDDEVEDELDDNLDEIGDMTKRLKALGTAMGQELDSQNSRIERIEGKTVGLDNKIFRNTERVRLFQIPASNSMLIDDLLSSRKSSRPSLRLRLSCFGFYRVVCVENTSLIRFRDLWLSQLVQGIDYLALLFSSLNGIYPKASAS